jgi:microcystin-dependent protein
MQVLGPSSGGGGGGGTVDPTTILATGDEKIRYGTGPLTGFVRENGLTIGSSVSGATERANADTQNLFVYLYGTDPNLVVSGGRTGNALNDFNANKTIALPDMRGRINAFLDDMGNTTAGRLAAPFFTTPTTLGSAGGNQSKMLTAAQIPTITSSGSGSVDVISQGAAVITGTITTAQAAGAGTTVVSPGGLAATQVTSVGSASVTTTSTNTGGQATPILPPIMLRTQYIKL